MTLNRGVIGSVIVVNQFGHPEFGRAGAGIAFNLLRGRHHRVACYLFPGRQHAAVEVLLHFSLQIAGTEKVLDHSVLYAVICDDGEAAAGLEHRQGVEQQPLKGMQLKELGMTEHSFHVAAIKRNHETIIPGGHDRLEVNDIVYFMTTREHVDSLVALCGKTQRKIRDVLIMGGSRIAIRLCAMAGDEFNFKIMDMDRDRCLVLSEKCPDATIINADARDTDALLDAGITDMDAFIALADSSETNILTCLSAKELGVVKTIAEVENLQFISEAEGLNIGTIINKKLLASSRIFQMLLDSDTSTSKCLALADAEVAEIVAREVSKITRGPVKDLKLSRDMTIAGLIRDGKGYLVSGNTVIEPGDSVVVFTLNGVIHKVEKLFK